MNNDPYDVLASVYDSFMDNSDETIESTAVLIAEVKDRYVSGPRPVAADLGCGTGRILPVLAKTGFEILAIDRSERMLQASMMRMADEGANDAKVLYIQQDLTTLDLGGSIDAMFCLLDTVNHLTDPADAGLFFRSCFSELKDGGVLVFDALRLRYMMEELGQEIYYDVDQEHALLWANNFDPDAQLNTASLTYFYEYAQDSYRREDAVVAERYYSPEQLTQWLKEAGFTLIEIDTIPLGREAEDRRHLFIAQK